MPGKFMNPSYARHMGQTATAETKPEPSGEQFKGEEVTSSQLPSIHIHSHPKGHTVHIFHKDGKHEKHEHEHGDVEEIKQHIEQHLGGGSAEHEPRGQEQEGQEY